MTFTKPVTVVGEGLSGQGPGVALGSALKSSDDGRTWSRTFDGEAGTHTATYRFAAADGHVLTGTFTFTVIDPEQSPTPSVPQPSSPPQAENSPTWKHTGWITGRIGLGLGMLGTVVGVAAVLMGRRLAGFRLTVAGAGILLIVGAILRTVGRSTLIGEPIGGITPAELEGLFGPTLSQAVVMRALSGVLFVCCALLPWGRVLPGLGAVALAVGSFVRDGHTVTTEPEWLMVLSSATHVLSVSVCAGGVLLLALLRIRDSDESAVFALRVAGVSIGAVLLVTVSGVVMAWSIAESLNDFVETGWGQVLTVKLAVVGAVLVLGWRHHRDITLKPGAKIGTSVLIEATLLLMVVALSAVLVGVSSTFEEVG